MRTTVTLDPDVEKLLKKEVAERGQTFKHALNDAIRRGLRSAKSATKPFKPMVFDMGKPKIELTKASSIATALEDEERALIHRRLR